MLSNVEKVRRKRRRYLMRRAGRRAIVSWTGGPAAPTYAGPGDVVSGATAWYGLRAYSAATAGGNAIRAIREDTQVEQDFVTLANGDLDVASLATFVSGTTGRIKTFYDQTGNGHHLVNTAFYLNWPSIVFSGIGSLPIANVTTTSNVFVSSGTVSQNQPFSLVGVGRNPAAGRQTFISGSTNRIIFGHGPGANTSEIYAGGSEIGVAATTNQFHANQGVFNGASSSINTDGSQATGDPGSSAFAGNIDLLFNAAAGDYFNGDFCETGMWPGAFSAGNITAMNSNIHTYWGF